jgi:hypothetical protein
MQRIRIASRFSIRRVIGLISNIGGRSGANSSRKYGTRSNPVGSARNGSAAEDAGGVGPVDIVLIFSPVHAMRPNQ